MTKSALALRFFGTVMGITSMGVVLICCSGVGLTLGGGSSPNDVRPTNLAVAQGSFTSQGGKTITGTAAIFNMGTSNYVLRLEGINIAPEEAGLQVQLFSSTGQTNFSLRAFSGSQNYTFMNSNPSVRFTSVSIYSTLTSAPYGSALLIYSNSGALFE